MGYTIKSGKGRLSAITIDTDKNMLGTAITNLKELAASMAKGDILIHNGSVIAKLIPGAAGQVLTSQGPLNNPIWAPGGTYLDRFFPCEITLALYTIEAWAPDESNSEPAPLTSPYDISGNQHADWFEEVDQELSLTKVTDAPFSADATETPAFSDPDTEADVISPASGAVADDGGAQTDETGTTTPSGTIDVGDTVIDRASSLGGDSTHILLENPVNARGPITTIKVWAATDVTNLYVGMVARTAAGTWYTRSRANLGPVVAGAERTISTSLKAEIGDFLAYYCDGGTLEAVTSGATGMYYDGGNNLEDGDEGTSYAYSSHAGYTASIRGEATQARVDISGVKKYFTPYEGYQAFGSYENINSTYHESQSFTPSVTHDLRYLLLELDTDGNIELQINIKADDGTGKPTGASLGLATVTVWDPSYRVYKVEFTTPVRLTAATKYHIVLSSGVSTAVYWRKQASTYGTYAGGGRAYSINAGVDWTVEADSDFWFEEYGTPVPDLTLLPAAVAVGDAYYIGLANKADGIAFDIGVAGAGTYDGVWEYSQGAGSWASCVDVVDGTDCFRNQWEQEFYHTPQGDWDTDTVNGVGPLYFIRFRVTDAGAGYSAPEGNFARQILII
jgi:hypothetical protein